MSETSAQDDQRLIEKALDGDSGAQRQLLATLMPVVDKAVSWELHRIRAAGRRRDGRHEKLDLVQQVLLLLLESEGRVLRGWSPEGGRSLTNYVRHFARWRARDLIGKGGKRLWPDEPTEAEIIELSARNAGEREVAGFGDLERRDLLVALHDRLRESLSPTLWSLFEMRYLEGLSVQEIVAITGKGRAAIDKAHSRLVAKTIEIAEALRSEADDLPRKGQVAESG